MFILPFLMLFVSFLDAGDSEDENSDDSPSLDELNSGDDENG